MVIQPSMEQLLEGVRQGTLDFTLTKIEDGQLLVSVGQVRVWKLADVLLGLVVLSLALLQIGEAVSLRQLVAFAVALTAGCCIVYSFWLILATFTFWFVRVENILMIFQAMYEAGQCRQLVPSKSYYAAKSPHMGSDGNLARFSVDYGRCHTECREERWAEQCSNR